VVLSNASILVVEDDLAVQRFIRRTLSFEGSLVVTASTGEQALSLVNGAAAYHLAVLDLDLPDMTGWDVLDAIRRVYRSHAQCPVIVLTSSTDDENRRLAASLGVGFLTKPIGARALVDGVGQYLHRDS
jgi:CheY-like chemotaxis protein